MARSNQDTAIRSAQKYLSKHATEFNQDNTHHSIHENSLEYNTADSSEAIASAHVPTPGLLRLPPELRLRIYELVATNIKRTLWPGKPGLYPHVPSLPITQTCRIIREESIPIIYKDVRWAGFFDFRNQLNLSRLRTVDPYALPYICGTVKFYCGCLCMGVSPCLMPIVVQAGDLETRLEGEACCEKVAKARKVFHELTKGFLEALEEDGRTLKEKAIQLIELTYSGLASQEDESDLL